MIINKTLTIAKREFLTAIKQRMFLVVTFGIPFFFIFIGGLSLLHTMFLANEITEGVTKIGIVDKTCIIPEDKLDVIVNPDYLGIDIDEEEDKSSLKPVIASFLKKITVTKYPDYQTGLNSLENEKISLLYIIPEDYMEAGEIRSYSRKAKIFTGGDYFLRWALRTVLLKNKVEPSILNRVQDPVSLDHFILNNNGEITSEDDLKFWGTLLIPYLASGIMMLTIFVPASYLLQSISEEKESKIIEVLLSSVTTEELLTGKMLGLGIAGLIQASVWLIFIAIPLSIGTVYFQISFINICLYFMYIIFGFMLYGSVMAGIGSIGYDSKQSAQLAGFCSAISVLPLLFMPLLVLHPNGWVAKVLSFFPFTTSVTMMVRISTDKLNYLDIFITILILIPSIYFIIKLSAKVFRTAILMYGKRITLREICKWLKS